MDRIRSLTCCVVVCVLLASVASGAQDRTSPGRRGAALTPDEVAAIAEEAYIFSFPMLMGYRYAFGSFLVPSLPSYRGAANAIHGEAVTLDHNFKDVITPNADTPYSMALLDLRAEPLVLEVPAVADRYYVMQFVDLFGTNPHFVGTRATGTEAGTYLIVGPAGDGQTGDEFDDVLRFETDLVFLIGRTQLLGPDDVPALAEVMKAYKLRPLSAYRDEVGPAAPPVDWPVWDDEVSRDERFIGYLSFLLQFCRPTHPSEAELVQRFANIGIAPGVAFDAEALDAETRAALRLGVRNAREQMARALDEIGRKVNGWVMADVFGDREFYAGDYLLRAAAAMAGWGGNDTIEAFYPTAREDADGEPLDGSSHYRLKLTSPPPCKAFWSVTIYDTSYDGTAGYLVENPIDRYLINSTTEGLVRGDDGSLEIVIQQEAPDSPEDQANWLPAPEGRFYLAFRIYYPEQAALDGTWTPPPVRKSLDSAAIGGGEEGLQAIAEDAYIFAYPMLFNHQIMYMQAADEDGGRHTAPFNEFHHFRQRLTADFTDVVGPNNNTLYSMAWLDLRTEPVVLVVPPIADERFYVHQFVDMFTHNFAYVGARETGYDGGSYLIAGPGWEGAVPEGITDVFRTEGEFALVLGRIYVNSDGEVPLVNTVQDQHFLKSLSEFTGTDGPVAPAEEIPAYSVEGAQDADFIGCLNFLLAHVEPHPSEAALYDRFAAIGIGAGKPFDKDALDPEALKAINDGVAAGLKTIAAHAPNIGRQVNGWNNFGAGFGSRESMQGRYLDRATAAMVGIYGNDPEENSTFACFVDGRGEMLDASKHDYVLHFPAGAVPPVKGFWSITMYDTEKFLMVPNPIDRFSVWGEDPMLEYGDDGALPLYLQKDAPGGEKDSNWLPAPDAPFGLALRTYWPGQAILDDTWDPPAVRTVAEAAGTGGLEEIAYEAFIYAYPLMEQVKTVNGMVEFLGLALNKPAMNPKLPWDSVGMPIVAPNLTSMTGGVMIDISHGPVTFEIPEVKDRYIVYQCIDVFTHNFYYMGTRADGGEGGRFVFHSKGQQVPETGATLVEMEGDHAIIVVRIDIKDAEEYDRVRAIQNAIKVVDAPAGSRAYPAYDKAKAFSPAFVEYVNELLTEVPESETEMFERFAKIGIFGGVELSDAEEAQVQAGIDAAFAAIDAEVGNLVVGNGYVGATEVFGTREFLDGNYLGRAAGAHFGLWGNSKEEANYFMTFVEGEGQIVFGKDDLPPLTDIGFWSITVHDGNVLVHPNEYDSYVLTTDKMVFGDDGSLVIKISSKPEDGNWLYTPGGKMAILIRAYQADPEKIGSYVPPAFEPRD